MSARSELREKLLEQELKNLETTVQNLVHLDYKVDGVLDKIKHSIVKSFSGHKDAKDVLDMLHNAFPGTNVDKHGDVLSLKVNGQDVEVKQVSGVWAVVVGEASYPADMNDLKKQILNYTASKLSGTKMHEVMRCSRAVMMAQRCGFSR